LGWDEKSQEDGHGDNQDGKTPAEADDITEAAKHPRKLAQGKRKVEITSIVVSPWSCYGEIKS
jgi:hypothetical protein